MAGISTFTFENLVIIITQDRDRWLSVDRERFIQKGAARLDLKQNGNTREFYFVLLPKLTMLAFSAAVEPLRIANQLTKTSFIAGIQ